MEGTAKHPPAGWYEDPDDRALQRFWDGSRWTSSRMPRNEAVPLEGEEVQPLPATRYRSDAPAPPAPGTADAATGLPAAAWYQDPENPLGMRYWDGAQWTEHRTDYLDLGGMSKSALIEQLSSSAGEEFTPEQAQYAADKAY